MWMIRDFAALDKLKGRHEVRVAPLNSDDEILWDEYKTHYFSQYVWISVIQYWGLSKVNKMSTYGKEAHNHLKFFPTSGPHSYDVRRKVC